ncbi:MAG: GerAB/ArcD/ProY family transporter [Thermoplasmata archaeon]|nr:GerAB/ArcD/ProY family transporter [Thermoplasmata archaeon]
MAANPETDKISASQKRKLLKRRRLKRERTLLQLMRTHTKTFTLKISTIKVEKTITPKEGLAILIGTQVGAGVLGLPYAASKVGLIPALGILTGAMLLMLFTALIVLKLSVEMRGAQMSTIAQKTLGRIGGWIMYLSIVLMSFGALLAYLAGMGSVFASLFGINETFGAVIFWILASLVIYMGLAASGKTELIMSYLMLMLFIGIAIMLLPHAKLDNGLYIEAGGFFSMAGVAIFSLGCHTVIPDVYKGIGDYDKAKKVVIAAFLTPALTYAIFMSVFLLVFGTDTPEIATQGLEAIYGKVGNIIGNAIPLIAITTSYIGVGLAQQSNSREFLRLKKPAAWALTAVPPIIVYLLGVKNFADVLAFVGGTGDMLAFIILPILILLVKKFLK